MASETEREEIASPFREVDVATDWRPSFDDMTEPARGEADGDILARPKRFHPPEGCRAREGGPHTRRAGVSQSSTRTDAQAKLQALDAFGAAAMLLDRQGRILFANRAAEELNREGVFDGSRKALSGADPVTDAEIAAAVRAASSGGAPAPVMFHDGDGAPLVFVAAPVDRACAETASAEGERPIAMAFVFSAGRAAPSADALENLLGLTPGEARVASALALGDSETAVATRLGLSVNSLKTHRRRIYEKLGVTRQAQLVRLLARLPNWL